jgi:uncharacterized protein (TIRG00374 family)
MGRVLGWLRRRLGELLAGGLGVIVIAVVFLVVLPRIASYRDVWAAVQGLSWQWGLTLVMAAVVNVATFAPPYMAALPGLGFRPALAVTLASTASTYVAPGGPAVGMTLSFAMLRGWGFPARPITVSVAVTTVWNQFVIYGSPGIALALLTAEGGKDPLLQTAAFLGLAVFVAIVAGFVLALSSRQQARRVGDFAARVVSRLLRIVRRSPVRWTGESFVRFRRDTIGVLRTRWHVLTLATVVGHLSVYIVLIVTLRALGVSSDEVSGVEAFAAWTLARVLGSIPITPGGLGIVELGLTAALVAFGGQEGEVVAAVLVYRFLTVAPPLVLGVLAGATWRRHHPGWEAAQPVEG